MGSERLPGKVLLDIGGRTMLERVVRRVQAARLIDRVVVATTTNPGDDVVAEAASRLGADVVRGSEEDVLDRFHDASLLFGPDLIVRVCADSPLMDAAVCDMVIAACRDGKVDYASNKLEPTWPLGLDVEAFSPSALERAWKSARETWERSHVTLFIHRNPALFTLMPVTGERDLHTWRWTVDTPEDLAFARAVFARLGADGDFSWVDVVDLIEREPEIAFINSHVEPKDVEEG